MKYLYALYLLSCTALLQFTTLFWIGTKDNLEAVKSNLPAFMASRLLFNLFVVLIAVLVLWLVWLLSGSARKRIPVKKLLLNTFLLLNAVSVILFVVNYLL